VDVAVVMYHADEPGERALAVVVRFGP